MMLIEGVIDSVAKGQRLSEMGYGTIENPVSWHGRRPVIS